VPAVFIIEQFSPMRVAGKIRSSFALKQVRYKTALPLQRVATPK
jgi:Lrp/AsnC family leucine-responsive transcriptional regulator